MTRTNQLAQRAEALLAADSTDASRRLVAGHLVFLPERAAPRFFLWSATGSVSSLAHAGEPCRVRLVGEDLQPREIDGHALPLIEAIGQLVSLSASDLERAPASWVVWSLAAKLALELVGRERILPRIVVEHGRTEARWAVALARSEDVERVRALASAFPLAAHAVPVQLGAESTPSMRAPSRRRAKPKAADVWSPEALLRAFLDASADALVRAAAPAVDTLVRAASPDKTLSPASTSAARTSSRASNSSALKTASSASKSVARRRAPAGPAREDGAPWERRFDAALRGSDASFGASGFSERALPAELEAWVRPALGTEAGAPRLCFRLDLPEQQQELRARARTQADFALRIFLQSTSDPSLLVPAADVLQGRGELLRRLGVAAHAAEEELLRSLAVASRLFAPIARGLRERRPELVKLSADEVWEFLRDGAPALSEAGLGVILPAELTRSGQRRLKLRMRVGAKARGAAGVVNGTGALSLDEVLSFRWEVALAGEELNAHELAALAKLKAPIVQVRGQWVVVDPREIEEAQRLLAAGGGKVVARDALSAALAGSMRASLTGLAVEVTAEDRLARVLACLRAGASGDASGNTGAGASANSSAGESARASADGSANAGTSECASEIVATSDFEGRLRPYQVRGLAWLAQMSELGLGACLADDMGLGKTVQLLAFLLHRRATQSNDERPALLVAPTSVAGNWEREIARFAPSLAIVRHYGAERARSASELSSAPPNALVLTTYGLLRRDAELLGGVDWSVVALDEAQNVKNSSSSTARAARTLRASFRVALTGTPIENRLAELWSLSEFLNPGFFGPLDTFRREYAIPIERYGQDDVAERLQRMVRPFLLRRVKSDPRVIQDLPPKLEMKVVCTLTREQASLYKAVTDDALEKIEAADGIQRRGLVLALITALKQICNHPAHYLGESGPLARRSGKLERLVEMLDEIAATGERALVFTQFREMGERLVTELERTLGGEVSFLHGGVPRARRDAMVKQFQEDERAPRVFVLSLKAGGTGLNLTAASHVFHFDRWWNPAVEDQATDRAHRIGQERRVQVHKFLCAGTIEEKVDVMLERKRDLAARIVGAGEQWITELDDGALRELFSLSADAVVLSDEPDAEDGASPRATAPKQPDATEPKRRRKMRADVVDGNMPGAHRPKNRGKQRPSAEVRA